MSEAADLLRDLLDSEPVPQENVNEYGVVISLPTIIVSANEHDGHPDEARQNLRVIPYERLEELMRIGLEIVESGTERQMKIFEDLFASLVSTYGRENEENVQQAKERIGDNPLETVLGLLGVITSIANDIDIDDTHADLTTCCLSFDMIRKYVNDPTTQLLVSAELCPYEGFVSYSQVENEVTRNAIRRERNDTDLNRFHYALGYFENAMRFVPGFICDRTVKLVNLALLHVWLASASKPICGLSSNTVKANMLAYAFDVIVRSRLLQAWRNHPTTRALLSDIARNYNSNQIMVMLCKLPDAKSRAKLLLREVARQEQTRAFTDVLSYETYERLLENTKENIEGRDFYLLDHSFVFDIMTSQNFEAIRQFLNPSLLEQTANSSGPDTAGLLRETFRAAGVDELPSADGMDVTENNAITDLYASSSDSGTDKVMDTDNNTNVQSPTAILRKKQRVL